MAKNREGLEHPCFKFRDPLPEPLKPNPEKEAFSLVSDLAHFSVAFMLIFGSLMTWSNWPSYSLIAKDWVESAFAQDSEKKHTSVETTMKMNLLETDSPEARLLEKKEILADIASFPPGKWLEIPQIESGLIPVQETPNVDYNYADTYTKTETEFQKALKKGVLHYPFTAEPGKHGNTFITGHSSYYPWAEGDFKEVFALLHKLKKGDEFYLYHQLKRYTYQVTTTYEVEANDVSVLQQPADKQMATLMTCTPIGTTLRRLIVESELVRTES